MGGVMGDWWLIPVSLATALVVAWLVLAITLWVTKPDQVGITDLLRLLPDTVRLLKRLAADRQLPRRIRIVLAGLLIFLASPIDLIPDFIPVLGYADDVIITALALRWVTRTAGPEALARHWPGTPDGLTALRRLCRLPDPV
ncbi:YkvA family protein [Mycolicibacterium psychrotolerans]|uniref:YkvA family protein n=1 Tax=Mycolicibacterium psychrotolerans TaxID=216929 RepID=UPI003D675ABD